MQHFIISIFYVQEKLLYLGSMIKQALFYTLNKPPDPLFFPFSA
jgi:hypothetical protein